jgi:hypothetical protein
MDNERCNECGAPHLHGMNCWEMLGGLLAWEAHDPALLAEHFLSVASYNIQHPAQFVDTAIIQLQNGFIGYLDGSISLDHIREETRRIFNGPVRVLKPAAEQQPVLRPWGMTIADVYVPDQPEGAADRVRIWAATIRRELKAEMHR